MKLPLLAAVVAAVLLAPAARAAPPGGKRPQSPPTAEQIADKNVAARGGLEAWRKIDTMIWEGHLESERIPERSVPFVLEEKRPNKLRFEITAPSQRSLRVFNGTRGWRMKPGSDGLPETQPYTPLEVQFAREEPSLDGPLIDYRAKGTAVALEGVDEVEGRKAFRLGITLAGGERHTLWVDAETFLELRYDRTSYRRDGARGTVSVFYRDFRVVNGLSIPAVIEIGGGTGQKADRMLIERVALNPPIGDFRFERPGPPPHHARVTITPPQLDAAPPPRAAPPASAAPAATPPAASGAPPK